MKELRTGAGQGNGRGKGQGKRGRGRRAPTKRENGWIENGRKASKRVRIGFGLGYEAFHARKGRLRGEKGPRRDVPGIFVFCLSWAKRAPRTAASSRADAAP